jgi:hypothetical protein
MNLVIKGNTWEIRFLTSPQYIKRFGSDSDAITVPFHKKICFQKSIITPGSIRHELLHAIFAECNTESATLDPTQVEEVCASILEKHWNDINQWTELILNKLTAPKGI